MFIKNSVNCFCVFVIWSAWLWLFVMFHFVIPMQVLFQNASDAPQKIEKHSVVFVLYHLTWIPVERVRQWVGVEKYVFMLRRTIIVRVE